MDGLGIDSVAGNTEVLSNITGQTAGLFSEMPAGTDMNVVGGRMGEFFDDVSLSLTPPETISLLEGSPSSSTIGVVRNTLDTPEYDDLRPAFAGSPVNEAKIIDFFAGIGQTIGTDTLTTSRQQMSLASNSFSNEELRNALLVRKYGDSLSTEQIQFEAKNNSDRNAIRAFKLLQNSNGAADSEPPAIVGGDSAIVPKNPPSVAYMTDRTLETLFESIIMTFNQAVHGMNGFVQTLSFKSRSRSIYEMLKQQDSIRNLIPPGLTAGAPPEGEEIHKSEINDNALLATKVFLEGLEFTPPTGELNFDLPTQHFCQN